MTKFAYVPHDLPDLLRENGLDSIHDRAIALVWQLFRHREADEWVRMQARLIRLYALDGYKPDVIEPLIAIGVLDEPSHNGYRPGERSKRYRVRPSLAEQPTRRIEIVDPRVLRGLESYNRGVRERTSDVIALDPAIREPLYRAASAVRWQLADVEPRLRDHRSLSVALGEPFLRTDRGGRLYTHVHGVKREIRPAMRIDGEPLSAFDVKASYLRSAIILSRVHVERAEWERLLTLYMTGDVYEAIGPTRASGKASVQPYLCDPSPSRVHSWRESEARPAATYFRERFPGFAAFVERQRGRQAWQTWCRRERRTMEAIYRALIGEGIGGRFVDEHDGARFCESDLSTVRRIAERVIAQEDDGIGRLTWEEWTLGPHTQEATHEHVRERTPTGAPHPEPGGPYVDEPPSYYDRGETCYTSTEAEV